MSDDEETVLVCMPNGPSEYTDNLLGDCDRCGREVMFRPHAPRDIPRVCIDCALGEISAEDKVIMTEKTARELADWRRKQLQ